MAGGIDWFRWHHGSVTDPKFQLVARKSKQSLATVIAVWAFVLEKASASEDRGSFGGLDCEAVDCLFGLDDGATADILAAMSERGLVDSDRVSSWEKRQVKRERSDDLSTDRVKAFRVKQRHETPDADGETPCNAMERQETPREEKRREEKDKKNSSSLVAPSGVQEETWQAFLKVRKAHKAPMSELALAGIRREADAAGWTLDAALQECATRGWRAFKAEWVADKKVTQSSGIGRFV